MQIDVKDVRAMHSLGAYIAQDLGPPVKGSLGRQPFWVCPFHEDQDPSLTVYADQRFVCFGCDTQGDIVDYVQKRKDISFKEALHLLATNTVVFPPIPQREPKETLDLNNELMRYEKHLDRAEPYLATRSVSMETARRFRCGYRSYSVDVEMPWGEQFPFRRNFVVVPAVNGSVHNIEMRCDDTKIQEAEIMKRLQVWMRWYQKHPEGQSPTRARMTEMLYGLRYWSQGTKEIFNIDLLLYHQLVWVLILENRYDAMALIDLGYPAIAIKHNRDVLTRLHTIMGNSISVPVWIADRDEAGIHLASEQQRAAGGGGRILQPPAPHGDVGDFLKADKDGLVSWLAQQYIVPQPNLKDILWPN